MELSIKGILESQGYQIQKAIISREINIKDPKDQYITDQSVFKKSKEEKLEVKVRKANWLKNMRDQYPGFTRKMGGKSKYLQTIKYGEDI